jgi:hypothetical protein
MFCVHQNGGRIKMKRTGLIVGMVMALVVLGSMACCGVGFGAVYGSGHVVEKTFEVSDFSGVDLMTVGDLYIEMGEEEGLRIEAEDNLIEYFWVEAAGGTLKIDTRPSVLFSAKRPIKFYLTAKKLDTIVLSGSGNIDAPDLEGEQISITINGSGDLRADDLSADQIALEVDGSGNLDIEGCQAGRQEIDVSGSGDVRIDDLEADELQVRIDGSGNVRISSGKVDEQRVAVRGSGDYHAPALASEESDVTLTGSGSADVRVSERLEVKITGSGDTSYIGNPDISRTITGSGDLVSVGD